MADDVSVVAGAYTAPIATDDVGAGVQAQIIKLAIATDGSRVLVPSDATDGLLVNLGANNDVTLAAGSANIGDVDILSVPAPLNVVGGGTEATALRVTVANDSTGVVSVDDNGGSLTVDVGAALPAGGNNIGDVDVLTVPAPLSTTGGGTEATALRVTLANDSTGVVSVDDNGGSLTVDGSVTANAGTNLNTSALALEAGGNLAGAAASLAVMDDWDETDRAKVNPIAGQAGVQGGSGVVTALTQRVALATDVPLPAGTNAIGKLAANSGVDIGDVDVTSVGGNVTVVQPTASDLKGQMQITDGTDVADVLDLTNSNPLTVAIVDGAGTQITSFGGGVQYTEGDTDASITGTALVFEGAANAIVAATGDATNGLDVDVTRLPALPAGTNNIGDVDVLSIAAGDNNIGNVDIVTLPAKKKTYPASSNLDVTSLNGLAASPTHVAGWESPVIDNSTNKYFRYRITAKITVESAGLSAGEIKIHVVEMLDDSTWPDVFDGTQSAETVTSAEIRDAICRPIAITATTTTASRVYYLSGVVDDAPEKFLLFITQSTGTTLETTGNQVTVKGEYFT